MDFTLIKQILLDQRVDFLKEKDLIDRDIEIEPFMRTKQIVVISGVRRSGKSSLLYLLKKAHHLPDEKVLYFNFDDERLVTFTPEDFSKIHTAHIELFGTKDYVCFFDEIHNVDGWERYVNRLYEKGIKIYLTGSNAKLLSSEIATTLTGRNVTLELLPFSFKEFLIYNKLPTTPELALEEQALVKSAFQEYLYFGGFPLVVKEKNRELLHNYYQDVIYKDVIARYKITHTEELKQLAIFLASNIGKSVSYKTLQKITGVKSVSSIKNYLDYFSQAYLCFFVRKYDTSLKKQILNPRKIYWVDHALAQKIGFRLSEDRGRVLENIVFIELKRKGNDIFYHIDRKECDFVLRKGTQVTNLIQVCATMYQPDTRKRELEGLMQAMAKYNLKKGLILTENEEGREKDGTKVIDIKPLWKWLLK